MTDLRLIVFDMDGTLVDSQHVILATMRAAFAAVGAEPPSDAAILGIVGLSLPEAVAVLAAPLGPRAQGAIVAGYLQGFAAAGAATEAPLYPGARGGARPAERPARDAARGGDGQGAARARPRVRDPRARAVLRDRADRGPASVQAASRDAAAALAETGCGSEVAVMVGDTEFDILMGRAAGFATIGVTWGYHPADRLRAAGADLLIESFDALDDALAALFGAPR